MAVRGSVCSNGDAITWMFNAHIEGMADQIPHCQAEGSLVEELAALKSVPFLGGWIRGLDYDELQVRLHDALTATQWRELTETGFKFAPVGLQSKKDKTVALAIKNKDAGKGSTLLWIAAHCGLTPEQTASFGDGTQPILREPSMRHCASTVQC